MAARSSPALETPPSTFAKLSEIGGYFPRATEILFMCKNTSSRCQRSGKYAITAPGRWGSHCVVFCPGDGVTMEFWGRSRAAAMGRGLGPLLAPA